ncbi:MAG TPA: Nif3-like dinuclear metal center hexameric protein [Candidatus Blautia avistercoris]|nr:Nif3-like dinuclear metal center hexameric protein [Candidatus Blautia avistercoris]
MKCKDIIKWLEEKYPVSYAEDWDNVGLLVGSDEKEVKKVFLALDLTEETLGEAVSLGADMIITHHPMIFSGIKKINNHSFTGRRILSLVEHGISYYAMHTNYDVKGMASLSAEYLKLQDTRVLSVTEETADGPEGFGRVGKLPRPMSLKECALHVKDCLQTEHVNVYGNLEAQVTTAAVCTGSGKSMIDAAIETGAEVYITGDIDHHTGIDTVAKGLFLIDAGHYGTEYMFTERMGKEMREHYPELEIVQAVKKFPYACI